MTPNRLNTLNQEFQDALLSAVATSVPNMGASKGVLECVLAIGANAAVNELQAAEERGEITLLP